MNGRGFSTWYTRMSNLNQPPIFRALLLSNYYNFLGKVSLLVNNVSFAAKILNIFKSLIENVSVKGEGIRGKVDVS